MKIYRFFRNFGLCALIASSALPALGSQKSQGGKGKKPTSTNQPAATAVPVASPVASLPSPLTNDELKLAKYELGVKARGKIAPSKEAIRERALSNRQEGAKTTAFKQNTAIAVGLSAGLLLAGSYLVGRKVPLKEQAAITVALASLLHWNRNEIFTPAFLNKADEVRINLQAKAKDALGYAAVKGKDAAISAWGYAKRLAQSAKSSAQSYMAGETSEQKLLTDEDEQN